MPGGRRRRHSKGRRDDSDSRRRSLAWSSDDTWSDNTAQTKSDHNSTRHDRPPPRSLPSSSGSSIETTRVDRRTQRERRNAMRRYPSSDEQPLFTHCEDQGIRESLQQKLLSNNAARLGNIERCLLRAANRLDGRASVTAFEDALAADAKAIAAAGRGERVRWNEALWLKNKLKGRNRRHVAVFRIRAVLEAGHRGGRRDDDGENTPRHLKRCQRRDPFRARSHGGEGGGGAHGGGSTSLGRVGRTMSGSTNESGVCRVEAVRGRPAYPERWAIRQGTVGQWLHDVASPMEKRLFFEFVKDLETFEHRNGLDHHRVRSEGHNGIVGTSSRDDGTTILHLGPMLKAAIRFYV